jgi:hypothetical protein
LRGIPPEEPEPGSPPEEGGRPPEEGGKPLPELGRRREGAWARPEGFEVPLGRRRPASIWFFLSGIIFF